MRLYIGKQLLPAYLRPLTGITPRLSSLLTGIFKATLLFFLYVSISTAHCAACSTLCL